MSQPPNLPWNLEFTIANTPIDGHRIKLSCPLCMGLGMVVLDVRGDQFTRTCAMCEGERSLETNDQSVAWFCSTHDLRTLRSPPADHLPLIHYVDTTTFAHTVGVVRLIGGRAAEVLLSRAPSKWPGPFRDPLPPKPMNLNASHFFAPDPHVVFPELFDPKPQPAAQTMTTHRKGFLQMVVVLVNAGEKVMVWGKDGGYAELPTFAFSSPDYFAIERSIQSVTARCGVVLEQITPTNNPTIEGVVVVRARVVGGTIPTVAAHEIPVVDWVSPTSLVDLSMWSFRKALFEHFDLWEAPAAERMRAVVFGSWAHHPGHPTPPNSNVVDVAVGYVGKTKPSVDEMQAFGEREGRLWAERNISADVEWRVHVHHGMQKPAPNGMKVSKIEFLIPGRVNVSPGYIGIRKTPLARGGLARSTDPKNNRDPRVVVEHVVPWAYGGQAISLSTLLFSATTITEIVNAWRYRPAPIILRLDDPGDMDRLSSGQGFGLSNLRNAIRHSTHLNVFDHAMNHVPWGELVRKLATKDPHYAHLRWAWSGNESSATLLLFPDGVARVRQAKMFDDRAHRTETDLHTMVQGFAVDGLDDGGYGMARLGPAFIREPIPYHTICREMFRKKG